MTDWEEHLEKQCRRQKIAKRVSWCVVFCILMAFVGYGAYDLCREPDFTEPETVYGDDAIEMAKFFDDGCSTADDVQFDFTAAGITFTIEFETGPLNDPH